MLFSSNISLPEPSFKTPVSFDDAGARADALLAKMNRAQKLALISGHNAFYLRGFPELGIPQLYMSDASGGINIRRNASALLEKSVAFPNPLALAATWNPGLAYHYARSIGEECRAGGVAFLLGPGMNLYRHAQYGRNFEYFGEDPFLAARIAERYVTGVLDTGTIPTIKHFIANETDHYRRTSNSIVDERTLHEIYLPAFQAAIATGAMAVMTSYNLLNGEWCGQSRAVIHDLLRGKLGYKWLVMTDWSSVWDAKKIIQSGQDLEMPGDKFLKADADRLLSAGEVSDAEIDRMVKSILRTTIAMGLHDRPVHEAYFASKFAEHEQVALQTAREAVVLLKNNGVLPLRPGAAKKILLTGRFVEKIARGLGSAEVDGYNHVTLLDALRKTYGDALQHVVNPTDEELQSADVVLLSTGMQDSEGWDRPFALPADDEERVRRTVAVNPRTVVIVNAGGGIQMTAWNDRAAAIVYAWYPGQNGNSAVAEIVSGVTNPSGKLPITIERRFEDSPGYGYIPEGEKLYVSWNADNDMSHPVTDVVYREGVFVGYRWYEHKKIAPLYAFGHGLSYTTFAYSDLRITPAAMPLDGRVSVEFTVTNTGKVAGSEVAQIYLRDPEAPVPRPEKELKGFNRVALAPGESKVVRVRFTAREFAYWDVKAHAWHSDARTYAFLIGPASNHILLEGSVTLQ
jgi:beta-glucosidase